MQAIVYFLVSLVSIAINVLQILLMIRAVLSWFPLDDSSSLLRFINVVTEPILIPIRQLLDKSSFFSGLPIDLSLFVAYLLLMFVSMLLPTVSF